MPDDRVERFNRLLDKHTIARLKSEDASAIKLYQTLERTRADLYRRLLAFEVEHGTTARYTSQYLAAIIDDITQVLAAVRDTAVGDLRQQMLSGFDSGQEQLFKEVAVMRPGFMTGRFKPKVPTDVMTTLIEGRTQLLADHFNRVRTRLVVRLQEQAAGAQADADAMRRAGATVEEIQTRLAQGIASGQGTRGIAKSLMAPGDGEFVRLTYREAILTTRLALNEAFNEGRAETLRDGKQTVPELRQKWLAAKVRSTPVCLCLHGQAAEVGQAFVLHGGPGGSGAWMRPPAIGQGANPGFHLCRSCLVPDHPDWPCFSKCFKPNIFYFLICTGYIIYKI